MNEEESVRRAVSLISEALGLLDAIECTSAGAALLDHAMHTLIADYAVHSDGCQLQN